MSAMGIFQQSEWNTLRRMWMELDHIFICSSFGAPEVESLVQFGLLEGPANQHPGQGTACRRFSFANAMKSAFPKSLA
jgi:hypothetical protein